MSQHHPQVLPSGTRTGKEKHRAGVVAARTIPDPRSKRRNLPVPTAKWSEASREHGEEWERCDSKESDESIATTRYGTLQQCSGVVHEEKEPGQGSSTVNNFGKAEAILGPCLMMFRLPATHPTDACQWAMNPFPP